MAGSCHWVWTIKAMVIETVYSLIGIWIVGNIGREQGSIKPVLVGCYALAAPYLFDYVGFSVVTLAGKKCNNFRSTTGELPSQAMHF